MVPLLYFFGNSSFYNQIWFEEEKINHIEDIILPTYLCIDSR
jgi:hypothetical protein